MMNIRKFIHIPKNIEMMVSRKCIHSKTLKYSNILSNFKTLPQSSSRSMAFVHSDYLKNFLRAIPFLGFNQTKLKAIAYNQFEMMVDDINYSDLFEELDLPDTFYSWFVVTELHLWMLSARAMAEGNDGRLIRNTLVEALWADVLQRVKKLESKGSPFDIRTKIVELSEQLQASFISYDEGILSEDIVLSGALWRRFYQQSDVDMENIEKLVKYVRRNMQALDNLNADQLYEPKNIKWCSVSS